MKRRDETGLKLLHEIPNGDAFEYGGQLYIAADGLPFGDRRDCVNLETGERIVLPLEMKVRHRLVELIVLNDVDE